MDSAKLEKLNKPSGSFPYISLGNSIIEYFAHYHEEIEVVLVLEGTAHIVVDMVDYTLIKNDICFIMPGQVHSFKASKHNKLSLLKISPSSYVENTRFDSLRLANCKIGSDNRFYNEFRPLIDGISREYYEQKNGYEFAIRSYKNMLISNIIRLLEHTTVSSERHLNLINEVNNYIEKNYSQPITLDDVAVKMRLSKYYFAHLFKDLTSMSFMTYLASFRLEKAKKLMLSSSSSVTEIALECGFGNVRSFNRIFRQQTGLSPSEYKKNARLG